MLGRLLLLLALVACAAAGVPVYVMLPLDTVKKDGSAMSNRDQILSWLTQIKTKTATKGVVLDVWWGIVQQSGPTSYNWRGYEDVAGLCAELGLTFVPIMSFHQCGGNVNDNFNVPLPGWVTAQAGKDIFYKDREGHVDQEYISLGVDGTSGLFEGTNATPIELYQAFMQSFVSNFAPFIANSTIEHVQVSAGPAGELRYPAYQSSQWKFPGVGEFQNYDQHMLAQLSTAATNAGHPEWGHGGPDNAGTYSDWSAPFWEDGEENNYASDYGRFFLSWYSQALIAHGKAVIGAAKAAFQPKGLSFALKVSGVHWQYKTHSHAAECTAGYYNTDGNNGYADIAAMFKNGGATLDFTCFEMTDASQPTGNCGPAELVDQVISAVRNVGGHVSGENALPSYSSDKYDQIVKQARHFSGDIHGFSYLRLSDTLFQGGNLGTYANWVNQMTQ